MKELVGRKILDFTVGEGGGDITFNTDAGLIRYTAEGDCCSFTWIEGIDNPDALHDATVVSEEPADCPLIVTECPSESTCEIHGNSHDQVSHYGHKLVTTKGHCTIDFRNESNGYYGGWLQYAGGPDPQ